LANHNDHPGGLLLVVSHLFAVLVLVLWAGLGKKKKKLNVDMRNIFAYFHFGALLDMIIVGIRCPNKGVWRECS
jgi:hypothetical protein